MNVIKAPESAQSVVDKGDVCLLNLEWLEANVLEFISNKHILDEETHEIALAMLSIDSLRDCIKKIQMQLHKNEKSLKGDR